MNNNSSNSSDNFADNSNCDFDFLDDATRDSSFSMSKRDSSSVTKRDSSFVDNSTDNAMYDSSFNLQNNYLCGGFPDKMMMGALKELNINDIKDFLNHNPDKSKQFENKIVRLHHNII